MNALLFRTGSAAARHPWRVIGVWILAAVAAVLVAGASGGALHDNYTMPGTDSQRATDLLRERFPTQTGATAQVVLHASSGAVDAAALEAVRGRIEPLAHVQGVAPAVLSPDGRTAIVAINVVDFFLSLAIWGATTTVRIAG
mgnify:CR=1 FL=1